MKNLLIALLLLPMVATADIAVSNVKVFSGVPWQEVIVGYTITGTSGGPLGLRTIVSDNDAGISWTNVTYDAAALTEGEHQFRWNDAKVNSTNCEVRVQVFMPTYCIVDLSSGSKSSNYPVTYLEEIPSGAWTDEYKTTKLPLRLIDARTFIMGEDQSDESHRVTLSKPYYMGVFEVSQKQYELVMGSNPSSRTPYLYNSYYLERYVKGDRNDIQYYERPYNNGKVGDAYPVWLVTHEMLRGDSVGSQWPSSSDVDASSFMGKLRARTGIGFDLPTEAQWECACRAGTSTIYSYGNVADGNYMWYESNSSYNVHEIGTRRPNPWGLYDMHGNVAECCLDWNGGLTYGMDPQGALSDTKRIVRGGTYGWPGSEYCTSFKRWDMDPLCWLPCYVGFKFFFASSLGKSQHLP